MVFAASARPLSLKIGEGESESGLADAANTNQSNERFCPVIFYDCLAKLAYLRPPANEVSVRPNEVALFAFPRKRSQPLSDVVGEALKF